MGEQMSIPEFLGALDLEQLDYISRKAKEKAEAIRKGEKVRLWQVGDRHMRWFVTDDIERAITCMRLRLNSFVAAGDTELMIEPFCVYSTEVGGYLEGFRSENRKVDEELNRLKGRVSNGTT